MEGVVGALKNLHRSLRPGGLLLDVHPEPAPYRTLKVYVDGEVAGSGKLERLPEMVEDILQTRRILNVAIADGMFERRGEIFFECREHYDSVNAWEQLLAKPGTGMVVAGDGLVRKALLLMGDGRSEIVAQQRFRALSLGRT